VDRKRGAAWAHPGSRLRGRARQQNKGRLSRSGTRGVSFAQLALCSVPCTRANACVHELHTARARSTHARTHARTHTHAHTHTHTRAHTSARITGATHTHAHSNSTRSLRVRATTLEGRGSAPSCWHRRASGASRSCHPGWPGAPSAWRPLWPPVPSTAAAAAAFAVRPPHRRPAGQASPALMVAAAAPEKSFVIQRLMPGAPGACARLAGGACWASAPAPTPAGAVRRPPRPQRVRAAPPRRKSFVP
jgi:hypothetical protein